MSYLLGIDLGTTGVKTALFAPDGQMVPSAVASYPLAHPRSLWAEQTPEDWWQATLTTIPAVLRQAGVGGDQVRGIGLSRQMHGAVLLDAAGQPVRPCIIWSDQRTQPECDWLPATLGEARLTAWVANPALPGFTAPKLLWVRRHEPANWAQTRAVLLPKDFIRYRLTGELATEVSDAAGTLLYDVHERRWSTALLTALDLSPDLLPPCHESTAICGQITPAVAAATGLAAGTPVVGGGADNACAAVGNGVIAEGQLLGYEQLTAAAAPVPPGSDGLLWLPYLQGERTPHRDAYARGVLFGITPRHERGHVARAVLEGITFGLRDSAEIIRAAGITPTEIRLTGGGAHSRVWRQIVADILGLPLVVIHDRAGPAFGAALLAGVGTGVYVDLAAACAATVAPAERVTPARDRHAAYAPIYAEFQALYPPLKERFRAVAAWA